MRIYYIGDLGEYADPRLPGVALSTGRPVDVHDDALASELLALPWFSEQVQPAVSIDLALLAESLKPGLEEIVPELEEPGEEGVGD